MSTWHGICDEYSFIKGEQGKVNSSQVWIISRARLRINLITRRARKSKGGGYLIHKIQGIIYYAKQKIKNV